LRSCFSLEEIIMPNRFSDSMITVAIAAAASAVISVPITSTLAQAPAATGQALTTPWGEPDLQGIWTDEFDTPFQRPAKFANQEYFTEAQREELDKDRSSLLSNNDRQQRGSELDVAGGYDGVFLTVKRTSPRTSRIVDPPNGLIPPRTPEAQKAAAVDREFYLALLQATETCKNNLVQCSGGKYDPTPSPRRAEPPPATTLSTSIAMMGRRITGRMIAAWAADCRSSEPRSVAVSGESFRRRAASQSSTT
jgi:hypothetical protein